MDNLTPLREQIKMIEQEVTAMGNCGTGDGVMVQGILRELSPTPTILVQRGNGFEQPFSVNGSSLKLVGQRIYSEITDEPFSNLIVIGNKLMKKTGNDYRTVSKVGYNIRQVLILKK